MRRKILSVLFVLTLLLQPDMFLSETAAKEGTQIMASIGSTVSLGNNHSAAVTANGDLYCWGRNFYGQLGNETIGDCSTPVKVLENVSSVSLGSDYSAAVTNNGDLYCWGRNDYGQLGNGTTSYYHTSTPVKVLENVSSVSLGYDHSAAVTNNGDLYCWGRNDYGQLGNGTTSDCGTPVKVLENVSIVSLGSSYSAAVTSNGDLYCWGRNFYGQLGNGTKSDCSTPVKVLKNVSSVSLGINHSAAVTANGDLYCWGRNVDGQLGNGTTNDCSTPVKVLENVSIVSLGSSYSAAVTSNGDLYCWGINSYGQLGNGTTSNYPGGIVKVLENIKLDMLKPPADNETPPDNTENKLQCKSSCSVEIGYSQTVTVNAYEDSLDKLKSLTGNVTWKSANANIATVDNKGFILPTKYVSKSDTNETWRATGMISVHGISEGSTIITGTASDGSKVTCWVTVTESENHVGGSGGDGGGSFVLGEEKSGFGGSDAVEFFPANWSLKSCVFPVEIKKSTKENGSYTIRGAVGIGKTDWLDDDTRWNKYKKNVEDANKYTGRVDCLNSFKNTWGVKSLTAVSTDKFKTLPKLSVMGYFENTYDKNGNLVSSTGKLAADAKWSGSINWQFVTPIGPLYLSLSGSGKLSGEIGPKYDYASKSLKIVDGSLKFTPSVTLEGGYGIDKVATIGAQGTLSVPITIVPASKGEFNAKASVHVKLVFVIDWTHDLATYKTTLWDTTKQSKTMKGSNIIQLSEGTFSEMDTFFADFAGAWNASAETVDIESLGRGIADTIANNMCTLQEGILPSSLPMQAQIAEKNVMIFQAYDNTRSTLNSTVLKYSILENGVWSEPKAVLDDGCTDMYADMKVVNGKLALVWQKEKKEISGDVETNSEEVLKDIAQNSEIYFSVFNEETNTFETPISVTNNSYYDMMPQICDDSDEFIVSWVRNDAADLMQETGSNTIYMAKWNGNSFEEEASFTQAPGTIDDYVVYQNEEGVQSVFIGQANGITAAFDTNGDVIDSLSELMLASEDGTISGLNYTDGKISCISKGMLYSYDILSETLTSSMAGGSAFGSEVQYCSNGEKNGYIWSIYDEETGEGSILASMATENGYSEPVALCQKENVMWRYFSPVIDSDGNWQIVANVWNTVTDMNSLLYVTKKEESRLELAGASIDENDVVDGLTGVDYFVTNTEDTSIDNIEIEITLKDGSKITKTVPVTLLPGESKAGTAYIDLKNIDTAQNVTLSVYAENQEDKSESLITDKIGLSDISVDAVSSETEDEVNIRATLKNLSSVNANVTLHLYGDEKKSAELQKQEGISLNANSNTKVQFTVKKQNITYNENGAAYLTLNAVAKDGDYNVDNNIAYIMLYRSESSETIDKTETQATQIKVGYTTDVNKMKYKVTKVNKNGTGEVALTGTTRKKSDKSFTSLKIGSSITINGKSFQITSISKNAFNGYSKLKSVTIGKNMKDIGEKAFYKCTALTKITTPSKVTKIGKEAFGNCKKLKSVTIGKNVTDIEAKAFYKCTALTKITIPSKITKIGKQAFGGCKKLKSITIKTKKLTSKKIGSNAFKGIYSKATIKVPKSKLKVYKKLLRARGVGAKANIK